MGCLMSTPSEFSLAAEAEIAALRDRIRQLTEQRERASPTRTPSQDAISSGIDAALLRSQGVDAPAAWLSLTQDQRRLLLERVAARNREVERDPTVHEAYARVCFAALMRQVAKAS